MTLVEPQAGAWIPIPAGRGRWRLTLHTRQFQAPSITVPPAQSGIAELVDARSRKLDQTFNKPAQLTFTINGRSQSAVELRELQQDVVAWRWDETVGRDIPCFFGPVTQTEDQIDASSHVVNVTCHDYLALLSRRYLTWSTPGVYTQTDQDQIVAGLVTFGVSSARTTNGTTLTPGSYMPISMSYCNPDGSSRGNSGQLRDRSYLGGQEILEAIDNLANSLPPGPLPGQVNSFDYDMYPVSPGFTSYGACYLRLFYPNQGVTRTDLALVYGARGIGGLAGLTRTVNSSDYSNYVRVLGNNGSSDQTAPQLSADTWNTDATNGSTGAVGTWMTAENASDVNQQQTLNDQAAGTLASDGILIPSYTVILGPGGYRSGFPNMGDTVPLIVQSGRLNVNTTVRVLGISFQIGDDGQEDVALTVGRPAVTLAHILLDARSDINALARR